MKICPSCQGGAYDSLERCKECGRDLTALPRRDGRQLGGMVLNRKYELVEFLGEGTMGWVYRGINRALDTSVAIKLMKPASMADDVLIKRFEREAQAASRLNHPHIISIIDFGRTPGALLFIVSEYLRGSTLSGLLKAEAPLSLSQTLGITIQILSALDEAHSQGVIHRDLKPDNIIITPLRSGEDFVKVLDFGIAKLVDTGTKLTLKGQLFGTPAYMAPEQVQGLEVTPRADLYACGLILYEMLVGRSPFRTTNLAEMLHKQLHEAPLPPSKAAPQRAIPQGLEEALLRSLAKEPGSRFESASAFRQALMAIELGDITPQIFTCSCGHRMSTLPRFCPACGLRFGVDMATLPPGGSPLLSWSDLVIPDGPEGPDGTGLSSTLGLGEAPEAGQGQGERALRFQFVYREAERRQLHEFFSRDRFLVEILGPPGSGRSRLLDEVSQAAHWKGLHVFRAGPDPTLARTPWYPIRCLVAQALELDSLEPSSDTLQSQILASGLAPEDALGLTELFGLGQGGEALEPEVRLREAKASALRALLSCRTLLERTCILVDDVDDLDRASLAFMRDLAVSAAKVSCVKLVLTAERPIFPEGVGQEVLRPEPLGREHISLLLAEALEHRGADFASLVEAIAEGSRGNVLHVIQAISLLAEGGSEIQASLPDILVTRIGRLPAEALRLLQVISVLGLAAPIAQAKALCGQEVSLEAAIQVLTRRGFIHRGPTDTLIVAHPLIAASVRETIPADARKALHGRALEMLGQRGEGPIGLAQHARKARLGQRALSLLQEAASLAEGQLDHGGAADLYRQAHSLARWELLIEGSHPTCLALSLRQAQALRLSGDPLGAELVLREALGAAEKNPALLSTLLLELARLQLAKKEALAAQKTLQRALSHAIIAGLPEVLTEIYIDLGEAFVQLGWWKVGATELDEGMVMVTAGDGADAREAPKGLWRLLHRLAWIQDHLGRHPAAFITAQAALSQAGRQGHRRGEAMSHILLGRLMAKVGRPNQAPQHLEDALALMLDLGDRQGAAACLLRLARRSPSRAGELTERALDLARQVGWTSGIVAASKLANRLGQGEHLTEASGA